MANKNKFRIAGTTSNTFQVGSKGPILDGSAATSQYTLKLPAGSGTDTQVLATDGTGNLTWADAAPGAAQYTDSIVVANDAETSFTLSYTPTGMVAMSINGVTVPAAAATVSGATVTYDSTENEDYAIKVDDIVTISYIYGTQTTVQQLSSLSDVNLNTPLEGQSLTYDSANSKWVNSNSSGTPAAIANASTGIRIAQADGNLDLYANGVGNIIKVSSDGTDGLVKIKGSLSLDGTANLTILGGLPGQVLTTDGTGTLTWESGAASGSSGVSVPSAGGNVEIAAGGTTVVTATSNGAVMSGNTTTINSTNTAISGNTTTISSNNTTVGGNVTTLNANTTTISSNVTELAGNTTNITSTNTEISGNVTTFSANTTSITSSNTEIGGNSTTITSNNTSIAGNVDMSTTEEIKLGNVSNLSITGGSNGQFLKTDGSGNLSWATVSTDKLTNGNSNVIVKANANVNISANGTANVVQVSDEGAKITGNVTITGDFTVSGTTTTVNQTSLEVANPIIGAGGLANGDPLSTDDGKDRGLLQHYYAGAAKEAFMGWDNSNGEFAFGSDVSNNTNVITFTKMGNVRADYFLGNGLEVGNIGNVKITGGNAGQVLMTDGSGNLSWANSASPQGGSGVTVAASGGNVDIKVANTAIITATSNGAVISGNTTTIDSTNTSVGGNSLSITSTNTTVGGNSLSVTSTNTTIGGNALTLSSNNTSITGNVDMSTSANVSMGDVANVHIDGGTAGQILSTDGAGTLSWIDAASGGGASLATPIIEIGTDYQSNTVVDHGVVFKTDAAAVTSGENTYSYATVTAYDPFTNTFTVNSNYVPLTTDNIVDITDASGTSLALVVAWQRTFTTVTPGAPNQYDVILSGVPLSGVNVGSKIYFSKKSGFGANANIGDTDVMVVNVNYFTVGMGVKMDSVVNPGSIQDGTIITAIVGSMVTLSKPLVGPIDAFGGADNIAKYNWAVVITQAKKMEGFMGFLPAANAYVMSYRANGYTGTNANVAYSNLNQMGNLYVGHVTARGITVATVANVSIGGGSSGQVLTTDGTGNLSWSAGGGGSSSTNIIKNTLEDSNVVVQTSGNITVTSKSVDVLVIHANGANLTGNFVSSNVTTSGLTATGKTNLSGSNVSLGSVDNLHITGGSNGQVLTTFGNGDVQWASIGSNALIANGNTKIEMYDVGGTLPNTISFFTRGSAKMSLSNNDLTVNPGSIIADEFKTKVVRKNGDTYPYMMMGNGSITNDANVYFQTAINNTTLTLTTTGANIDGYANVTGNLVVAGKTDLGNLGNIKITGGTNTYQLTTDGNGNLTWVDPINASIANGGANLNFKDGGNMTLTLASRANLLTVDSNGLVTITPFNSSGGLIVANANATSTFAGNITVSNANAESTFKGSAKIEANLSVIGWANINGNVTANANVEILGDTKMTKLTANGNASFTGANVSLGNVANLKIAGATGTSFLKSDGSGNLSWGNPTAGAMPSLYDAALALTAPGGQITAWDPSKFSSGVQYYVGVDTSYVASINLPMDYLYATPVTSYSWAYASGYYSYNLSRSNSNYLMLATNFSYWTTSDYNMVHQGVAYVSAQALTGYSWSAPWWPNDEPYSTTNTNPIAVLWAYGAGFNDVSVTMTISGSFGSAGQTLDIHLELIDILSVTDTRTNSTVANWKAQFVSTSSSAATATVAIPTFAMAASLQDLGLSYATLTGVNSNWSAIGQSDHAPKVAIRIRNATYSGVNATSFKINHKKTGAIVGQ